MFSFYPKNGLRVNRIIAVFINFQNSQYSAVISSGQRIERGLKVPEEIAVDFKKSKRRKKNSESY